MGQRREAARWYRQGTADLDEVWTYFYSVGGDADELTLDAYLHELAHLPTLQVKLMALTMAEMENTPPQTLPEPE